jgi:hypothetical protein
VEKTKEKPSRSPMEPHHFLKKSIFPSKYI